MKSRKPGAGPWMISTKEFRAGQDKQEVGQSGGAGDPDIDIIQPRAPAIRTGRHDVDQPFEEEGEQNTVSPDSY